MIARCHGNRRLAARALGISYTTLKQRLREDRPGADAGEGEDATPTLRAGRGD
jgi:hypothetical protein